MKTKRIPPVWILSLPWLTFGMVVGFAIVTLPQMLAAQHVPGGRIATAVALLLSPVFWNFLFAPLLDVRFRRRTYALLFAVLAVCVTGWVVIDHASLLEVEGLMMLGIFCDCMFQSALGGWVGSLIDKEQDSRLGAWSTIFNVGGNGIGILISGYADRLSPGLAAAVLVVTFLAPLLVFPMIPSQPPGKLLVSENFGRFGREIALLLKRPEVLVTLSLFAFPAASFALTNALGGWSGDFGMPPFLVSMVSGAGLILGSTLGCLIVPLMARRVPLRPLYLATGFVGAGFALALLVLPRVPATFGLAFMGENFFQAAAIATASAITFEVIGPGNPLAATTFALLFAASNLPIDYMEVIDARGYDWRGISGALITDALISGTACVLLALLLRRSLLPAAPIAAPSASEAQSALE